MRTVVLETFDPGLGKRVRLGKVCQDSRGRWVYRVDRPEEGYLRNLDAWPVSPCVLEMLEREGIKWIHYHVKGMIYCYELAREAVRKYGKLVKSKSRPAANWHVPRIHFKAIRDYPTEFTNDVLTLEWVEHGEEQAPEAVQERLL